MIAHKPTIADENSMDALDRTPNREEPAEKSAGQVGRGAQFGAKCGFNACDRRQSNFRQPKVRQRHILGGNTLMDADARGEYRARSNIDFSCSMLFPIVLANAQRNSRPRVPILFQERFFRRSSMSATRSEFWNGGRS